MDDKQKSEVESTNEETEVEIEETQPTETEEVEEIEEESEQSPDEPTEAEPEDEPEREVEEEKPSRRESLRIQQVLEKVKRGDYAPQQQHHGDRDKAKGHDKAADQVRQQLVLRLA